MTIWSLLLLVAGLCGVLSLVLGPRGTETLRVQFLNHVALLASRGLPLAPGVLALAEERSRRRPLPFRWRSSRREAALLHGIAARLQSQGSLTEACAGAPGFLAPDQLDLLRRAEPTGALPAVLDRLCDEEAARDLAAWRALDIGLYPLVVTAVVIPVTGFVSLAILPRLHEVELAVGLRGGLDVEWLEGLTLLYLLVFFGAAACLLPGRGGRWLRWQGLRLGLALPLLGRPLRRWRHGRWMQRTGALLQHGATLPEALTQVASTARSTPGQARAAELAQEGRPLAEVLSAGLEHDASALVPSLLLTVTRAGSLPRGWLQGADRLATRAGRRLVALGEVLRPLPIVACALVVGAHALSVWSSIGSLQGLVLGSMW